MWFLPLLQLLSKPVIGGLVDGYKAKLEAGNTKASIAADLAQRELEIQKTEIQARSMLRIAQVGRWYEPEYIFAYIMAIYFGKIMLWDAALHMGVTDLVRGPAAEWAGLIMIFLFGKRGIENVARIIKG